MPDSVVPFLFEHRNVRGVYVEIETGVDAMLNHRDYADDVRRLIGEACAAAPLLMASIHYQGRLNLQFQGSGGLKLLVAQVDAQLNVRGMAKADEGAAGDLQALMGGGVLGLLLQSDQGAKQDYQAMVDIRGATLAEALEGYFLQSEQLATRLRLSATRSRLAGILIQRLPAGRTAEDDAHWEHLTMLFATADSTDLATTPADDLLLKVFPEEDIRVFRARPVKLACRCDHAGISAMLVSLGERELDEMLAEHRPVEVTCEFCGRRYEYSLAELKELSAAAAASSRAATRH